VLYVTALILIATLPSELTTYKTYDPVDLEGNTTLSCVELIYVTVVANVLSINTCELAEKFVPVIFTYAVALGSKTVKPLTV
jgi:hypothetical protein